MSGTTVPIYFEAKQVAWLDKQTNKSKALRALINKKIEEEKSESSIRKEISLLEDNKFGLEQKLNYYYNQLQTILETKEKTQNAEKERMQLLLKQRKEAKLEKHRKIEASPIYKDLLKLKPTSFSDPCLDKLIIRCRKMGNRDFGTYDLFEYLKDKGMIK